MPLDWMVDAHQYVRTAQASSSANHAIAQSEQARSEVQRLQMEVDRLTLVCRAMWSLLQDTSGLTEDDLMRRVEEVDLLDGKRDGRVQPGIVTCGQCGRNNKPQRRSCMYCGSPLAAGSAFG